MTRGDLNLFQIGLVNFVFFATMFLMEIPTGAFADCFGRKTSYVLSCGISVIALSVYATSHNFVGFITAEALGAISATFCSGAYQAWIVSSLDHHGYDEDKSAIFARESQLTRIVGIVSGVLGAQLAAINPTYPWWLGAAGAFVTGTVALIIMREDYRKHEKPDIRLVVSEFTLKFRASVQTIRQGGPIALVMLLGIVFSLTIQAPNMQWQPHFRKNLGSDAELGYVWAAISIALILGAQLVSKLRRGPKFERYALIGIQLTIGLLLAFAGGSSPWILSLGFFLLHEIGRGLFAPLRDAFVNDSIPESERATLLSCGSLPSHFGAMIGLLISGAVALRFHVGPTWIACGLAMIVLTLIVSRIRKHN
jgi:MFS family permease